MNVLVTGAGGMVGRELSSLALRGATMHARTRRELDIADEGAVERALHDVEPAVVVNLAAYTAVDAAEAEPELADRANHLGAGLLAKACARASVALVHLSSDFVFDGEEGAPYDEDDPIGPRGVYATTKARGEVAVRGALAEHVILRVAWLYSARVERCFPMKMLAAFRTRETVRVVADQRGCPTPALGVARAVAAVVERVGQGGEVPWGTFHFAGQPAVSRYEWAAELLEVARRLGEVKTRELVAARRVDFPEAAPRPRDSSLVCERFERAFEVGMPMWRDDLAALCEAQTRVRD